MKEEKKGQTAGTDRIKPKKKGQMGVEKKWEGYPYLNSVYFDYGLSQRTWGKNRKETKASPEDISAEWLKERLLVVIQRGGIRERGRDKRIVVEDKEGAASTTGHLEQIGKRIHTC